MLRAGLSVLFVISFGCQVDHGGLSVADTASDSGSPVDSGDSGRDSGDTGRDTDVPDSGGIELCNGEDDDGDSRVDEEVLSRPCGEDRGACVAGTETCTGGEFGPCVGAVGPSEERCGGDDEDCDGLMDEAPDDGPFYLDDDGDGYGTGEAIIGCRPNDGVASQAGDCRDDEAAINPGIVDMACDGVASDCGPEEVVTTYYADTDMDGFGDPAVSVTACDGRPSGFVVDQNDCDDTCRECAPGVPEVCDGLDNDCGGGIDDGACAGCVRHTHDGHTYQFCQDAITALTARDRCRAAGYELVTIDSATENQWVFDTRPASSSYWIGLNDLAEEGVFRWFSGSGSTARFWDEDEPNNSGGIEHCTRMRGSGAVWTDRDCDADSVFPFVCELPDR